MIGSMIPASLFVLGMLLTACNPDTTKLSRKEKEWRYYNGSPTSNKYSKLAQINKANVDKLELAWSYDMRPTETKGQIKCNAIVVEGVLYGTTASKNLVALDAATGEEKWYLDLKKYDKTGRQAGSRGILYWEKGDDKRIFYVYADQLYAVDAKNGQLVKSFGKNGKIHYAMGLGVDSTQKVRLTTPGVIYRDLIISGSSVSEFLPAAPGHIRAFSAITGELKWIFHTIPRPGEYGYDTWPDEAYKIVGGANSWGGMSLDEQRGIVYVPTASPTYDFYGANRIGQNLFANCILALNAETGERIWHYQIVHHDLWDRDLPCAPNLLTVIHDGRQIDALAQPTKEGYVFLFDRETGEPLFGIEEVTVPESAIDGEEAWPTQPFPIKPPPFTRQELTSSTITDISPDAATYIRKELARYQTEKFTPPDTAGVIVMPFFNGGANWGGAAIDEPNGTLIINSNDIPWLLRLIDLEKELASNSLDGARLYQAYCASCHGESKEGGHYIPSLIGVEKKLSHFSIVQMIKEGAGLMPAMNHITEDEQSAIAAYLLGLKNDPKAKTGSARKLKETRRDRYTLKYTNRGYSRFLDKEGYPAIKPPWATLTAIDLNKGEIKWQKTLGEYKELTRRGIPPTGAKNQGGLIITSGGLVFIASTEDSMFRAFDKDNGELLWEYELPGPGFATPSTYQLGGIQYLVIAVTGPKSSDLIGKYLAFKLPD